MNPFNQLRALMRKNLILMKRSCCSTICEIIFPMILMILLVLVRRAVTIDEITYDPNQEDVYYRNYSTAIINPNNNSTTWDGLRIRTPL
jgi:hypothetical protein